MTSSAPPPPPRTPHPKEQLAGTEIRPKKSFGQNFLVDTYHQDAIAKIAVGLARDAAKTVLELGPGLGALTGALLRLGATVHAIERDRDLVPLLKKRFEGEPHLTVHEDNALTFPLTLLEAGGALAGNLPYHHGAALCLRALEVWPKLGGAAFLVQLEVAERAASLPGSRDVSVLSVLLQSRFEVSVGHVVKKGAFWPPPEVDGGVVVLRPRPEPQGAPHAFETLHEIVKPAFAKRRKTLRNALAGLPEALELLPQAGIALQARAEDVPVAAWGKLAALLQARREAGGGRA